MRRLASLVVLMGGLVLVPLPGLADLGILPTSIVWAQGLCGVFYTYKSIDTVTSTNLNGNILQASTTNSTPQCVQGDSATLTQMQATVDPFPNAVESLATSLEGELQRLRFVLTQATGWTQWYSYSSPSSVGKATGVIVAASGSNLQTLINNLPANGGTIIIPSGVTVTIASTVTYPTAAGRRVAIVGEGWGSIIQWTGGSTATMLTMPSTSATQSGHSLRNLQLNLSGTQTGVIGLQIGTASLNPTGAIIQVTVDQVLFNGLATCVRADAEVDEVYFSNNWCFGPTAQGIIARRNTVGTGSSNSNWTLIGNHFQGLSDWAVDMDGGSGWHFYGNTMHGTANGARGVTLDRVDGVIYSGNYHEFQGTPTGPGLYLGATTAAAGGCGAFVAGNHFDMAGVNHLTVDFCAGATITGNWFKGSTVGVNITANATNLQLGTQAFDSTVTTPISGGIGIGSPTAGMRSYVSGSETTVLAQAANENAANFAGVRALNSAADQIRIGIQGRSATGTTAGLSNAALADLLSDAAAPLLIRTSQAQPIVFAPGNTETFRLLSTTTQGFTLAGTTFANLGAPANGTLTYCSDCNATCTAGASTGKWCGRTNGAWAGAF